MVKLFLWPSISTAYDAVLHLASTSFASTGFNIFIASSGISIICLGFKLTSLLTKWYLTRLLSGIFVTIAANIEVHSFLNLNACKLLPFFCLKSSTSVPVAANPASISVGLTWTAASETCSFAIFVGLFADSNNLCITDLKFSSKERISIVTNGNIGASV